MGLCLLVGCATGSGAKDLGEDQQLAQAQTAQGSATESGASSTLSTDALFDLMVGELSARQGDTANAARSYLSAAQRTRDVEVAERAARIALFARDYPTALTATRLWSELDPTSIEALQTTASLLLHSGDAAAQGTFETLFDRLKEDEAESAFGRIGELLSRGTNKDQADQIMRALVERDASNPLGTLALARYLARSERYDEALVAVDQYLAEAPDDVGAITLKSELQRQLGDVDAALATLDAAVKRSPDSGELHAAYARGLMGQQRFADARVQFERALELDPDNVEARYAFALVLLQTEALDEAREQFTELTGDVNRRYNAYYYLGRIAEGEARYDDAVEAYRKVDRGEQRMSAQMRIAQVLADQGKLEQARAHLHGLQGRTDAERVALVRAEGDVLHKGKRYAQAMALYDAAVGEFPDDKDLLYARAMTAEKLDRVDLLERDLRKIIDADPDNAEALNALGYTLADRTDRYEEALALIQKAVELQPESHYIVDSLGWVLYRMGRLAEAAKELRRALEMRPDAEIAAHLGEVLWMLGERKQARDVWDTALESTPDDETLINTRKRFGL